ncbi:MAG: hypothetical protein K2X77_27865 [Candidatus Obscuribacterales bacterium]|nr:hypothetical protein [Candidatus Obscuribacterales bacterium]
MIHPEVRWTEEGHDLPLHTAKEANLGLVLRVVLSQAFVVKGRKLEETRVFSASLQSFWQAEKALKGLES